MKKAKHPQQHYPRKRFGQHFLTDTHVISKIIQAAAPKTDDNFVEIGPGRGALTHELLPYLEHLNVIELDRDLIPLLEASCAPFGKLNIFQADALEFDFRQLCPPDQKIRIIGNLPYNISTPLLFHLVTFTDLISDMIFMLQKEVVDRMSAYPGDPSYGRLSVMIQYFCDIMPLFNVEPNAFSPPPGVQSSIVRLIPHPQLPFKANNWDLFAELVRTAFNQRRKTLHNSLKSFVQSTTLEQVQINPKARAEELSVADFVRLSNFIGNQGLK